MMIISCPCGKKKFEIEDNLIPKSGRLLQCGSCDHQWKFIPEEKPVEATENKQQSKPLDKIEENINFENIEQADDSSINTIIPESTSLKDEAKTKEIIINEKIDNVNEENLDIKKESFNYFNYLIVIIISLIALIILVDTFKSPISILFPNIDFILNNLYETVKDIILFFKDLF